MKTIKFRARDLNGKYHYGGVYRENFDNGTSHCIIIEKSYDSDKDREQGIYYLQHIEVVPDSVCQYLGSDKFGNDVYEHDIMFDDDGNFVYYVLDIVDEPSKINLGKRVLVP